MLNIYSLNNVRDQKEINKFEIYKMVLKKCHHRIKVFSKKGDSCCFYIVPEFIYGIPRYDTLNCAAYIVTKLRYNGFTVNYTYPNLIFINWTDIPSEIKNPEVMKINSKEPVQKILKQPEYRYIEDYKSSNNFLNRLNKSVKYLN